MIKDERWEGVYSFEDSPYLMETLTNLRNVSTENISFRKGLVRLGRYMGYELTKTMEFEEMHVQTPLEKTKGIFPKDRSNVVIITILRAAFPLMEGLIKNFESAKVGIVSASRGHAPDFKIEMNYIKVPQVTPEDTVIVSDPMIATGSTLIHVLKEFKDSKPKRLMIVGVLAAPEGINAVKAEFPDVEIFVTKIDDKLNNDGYIVPGLGDAGDRAFGEPFKVSMLPQMHNLE
ncbi:uracil phosphoribosyltransferase [Methanococcus maripaludis]|jgi:uracil phosphoribosyltransferase|uniref:Uracil phosphoribosyltransferase n=3 Tax=Methanococcus maripaludis TaxID=39152 RepID=A0A2L1C8P1_METMI|nr:uracil phosphoribosyltransferase [Methanococcus maripaludis]AEK19452.1 uracil phosphoribosyltransferase [Methanococcus maripaludis X1]AVB75715.1 Uracil phosphoribosyltransferase [Methanococcus maripaludis]MBA2864131.1 uracil phosphoribosyltransferase [Methanococcus maripaludis]MBB6067780.1 uracil phosphoribosyltransferase [Methanococcus maripaludis]MBB6497057.1 uracil phosphoribosyltransferase [Methanococcus maripaludis]